MSTKKKQPTSGEIESKFAGFKSAERPSLGLAVIFDISGFTNFFNKPDIYYYMNHYINTVIDCFETNIWGGLDYWVEYEIEKEREVMTPLLLKPTMRKFLGDGMLYVWEDDDKRTLVTGTVKGILMNRLWNMQKYFNNINKVLTNIIPVSDLPKAMKIGMAQGSIYKLTESNGDIDFIGPCINLASRLVKYCPELNFIASARLNLEKNSLEKHRYVKTIATEIRSFEQEIVIVDKGDFESLNQPDKERLFRFLPS